MTAVEFNYVLYNTSRFLRPFALRLTKDYDDANDLLQDTLVKAFLNREKYIDGTNLKAWLYTIMKNTFITNYQKMLRKHTLPISPESRHLSGAAENGAFSIFAQEDISRALHSLEDAYREPFMMYFNGYRYHEIADKLNVPIGTVKNRIHLARKELKDKLSRY